LTLLEYPREYIVTIAKNFLLWESRGSGRARFKGSWSGRSSTWIQYS